MDHINESSETPKEAISGKNSMRKFMGFLGKEVSSILLFQETPELKKSREYEENIKKMRAEIQDIEAQKALRSISEAYDAANGMRKRNTISIVTDISDILPVAMIATPWIIPIFVFEIAVSLITTIENLRFRFRVLSPKIKSASLTTAEYTGKKVESILSVKNIEDFIDIVETFLEMYAVGQLGSKIGLFIPPLEVFLDTRTRMRIYDIQKSLYLDALAIQTVYLQRRLAKIDGKED